jgi:hypothetical protein
MQKRGILKVSNPEKGFGQWTRMVASTKLSTIGMDFSRKSCYNKNEGRTPGRGALWNMSEIELAKCLHAARDAVLAVNERDSKALRRKLLPDELVASAKSWAERLLDLATVNPGHRKLRTSSDFSAGGAGPQMIYAEQIAAAQSIVDVIAALNGPMAIVKAFKDAFPAQFAGVRMLLPYIRTVTGQNGIDTIIFTGGGKLRQRGKSDCQMIRPPGIHGRLSESRARLCKLREAAQNISTCNAASVSRLAAPFLFIENQESANVKDGFRFQRGELSAVGKLAHLIRTGEPLEPTS